ncbi:recombinase family protein [Cryobacterium cheniae]|uniref:recombinase family protein n=1 Tax=Cryobacterium cheniae TaxID=1259262 RepID=UPI0021023548|nr:recombinase family protein [Cryobacterium cheniae]
MTELIGYARVSTRQQSTDRHQADILAAGVRRDGLYVDEGVSGARATRPHFDRALDALEDGDTLVITTLDRLGRSTQNMLDFAKELRGRGAGLRVLNLGGGDVDTATPMGPMLFTIMAALGARDRRALPCELIASSETRSTQLRSLLRLFSNDCLRACCRPHQVAPRKPFASSIREPATTSLPTAEPSEIAPLRKRSRKCVTAGPSTL